MRDIIAILLTNRIYKNDLKYLGEEMMTYNLMKRIILKGGYDHESTMNKLDVFLMADRITPEEYQELIELMGVNKNG